MTNLALVIPALPLMIVIAAYLPNKGVGVIILVVVLTGWATGARVMRSQTKSLQNRDFVDLGALLRRPCRHGSSSGRSSRT